MIVFSNIYYNNAMNINYFITFLKTLDVTNFTGSHLDLPLILFFYL